ncbi:hypothetical protein NLJ89_g9218 [Agrocybe chaxingu]|uniref:DUF6699 domain-containing protein n=1 Tax=Agrocybe chaxingu TaxID=84603 RepID=A0A9W8MTB7_9AGAR|nr:hypothetical protein NLJ89_g9218 [Agrocybe chaxingu]
MFSWGNRSKGHDQPPSSGGFFRRVIPFNRGSSIPRPQTPQTWNPEPPYGPGPPQGTGPSTLYNQYYAQPQYHSQNDRPQHNSWQTSDTASPQHRDKPAYRAPRTRLTTAARNLMLYLLHLKLFLYGNNDYYSSSSRHSSRADPPPRPRQTNASHTPYFDPPDFLQNRRDSAGSQHESWHHDSDRRSRANPYANTPRGTPWQSSASLARTDESGPAPSTRSRPDSVASHRNPASQSRTSVGRTGSLAVVNPDPPSPKYQLAPELRVTTSSQCPWINYAIWLKPSTAELMVAQGKALDVKRRELAINPPVGRPDRTKPITVYNILFEIWDYFQQAIKSHEWPEFEAKDNQAFMLAIEASFEQRQTVPDTGIPWAENARAGGTRADTLFRNWMFGGLELDKDFEKNRVVRMKLSNFDTYDDR